jgi:ArsR family transcriptional regulator
MCNSGKRCVKPDELKGKPEDCSPRQIQKCHGKLRAHPCSSTGKNPKEKGKTS